MLTTRHDYSAWTHRFNTMHILPQHLPAVQQAAHRIQGYKVSHYDQASHLTGVPWDVIGCIDALEESFDHTAYLGNGEPLNRVTRLVPKGRGPWHSWQEGAADALKMAMRAQAIGTFDQEIGFCLHFLEWYNGAGYAHMDKISPYIFSFSDLYTGGKFVETKDSKGVYHSHYDPKLVSKQVGAACILKLLRAPQAPVITRLV